MKGRSFKLSFLRERSHSPRQRTKRRVAVQECTTRHSSSLIGQCFTAASPKRPNPLPKQDQPAATANTDHGKNPPSEHEPEYPPQKIGTAVDGYQSTVCFHLVADHSQCHGSRCLFSALKKLLPPVDGSARHLAQVNHRPRTFRSTMCVLVQVVCSCVLMALLFLVRPCRTAVSQSPHKLPKE